ncbi:MAG TPA: hypothetical protein VD788_11185 [Candidatus Polarisedimenticolaceae bacterium]|nr:hypothetical protein [Candidatus Polarisedimenticolaceae bacterium]
MTARSWIRTLVPLAFLSGGYATTHGAPGEPTAVTVVDRDPATGELSIRYEPACDAADHHIEYGRIEDLGPVLVYSGQVCGIGTTGAFDGVIPESDSFFFLVVGNDGVALEGSYGTSLIAGSFEERADDTLDPGCALVQQLVDRCDLPTVELTAYRPQSEAYGAPLMRRAVPEAELLSPGVGIRVNGDDDDDDGTPDLDDGSVIGENDLIELTLAASLPLAPAGLEYALIRTSGDVRVWSDGAKGTEILGTADEAIVSFAGGPLTTWLEQPTAGSSSLTLVARRTSEMSIVASAELSVFTFSSIVIALGGEDQVPGDPPLVPGNHGTFEVAIELYRRGYDVHMYDEDVVSASGAGLAFDEVVSAVRDRGVGRIAIYGYSHGAGSTNDLARRLDDNRASIGTFSIDFTGYVDAIDNDSDIDIGTETELPPSTGYHANYYENPGCGLFVLCGGPIAGADFDLDVNTTPWGAELDHFTVDDAPEVIQGLLDQLVIQVAP